MVFVVSPGTAEKAAHAGGRKCGRATSRRSVMSFHARGLGDEGRHGWGAWDIGIRRVAAGCPHPWRSANPGHRGQQAKAVLGRSADSGDRHSGRRDESRRGVARISGRKAARHLQSRVQRSGRKAALECSTSARVAPGADTSTRSNAGAWEVIRPPEDALGDYASQGGPVPPGPGYVCAPVLRIVCSHVGELRVRKIRIAQVGSPQIAASEASTSKRGAPKVGTPEIAELEVVPVQGAMPKIATRERLSRRAGQDAHPRTVARSPIAEPPAFYALTCDPSSGAGARRWPVWEDFLYVYQGGP